MNLKEDFGRHLKSIRTIKGLTQEKLSELIGIEQRQLSRIETGRSFISFATFEKICIALEVTPLEFFGFSYETADDMLNSELKEIIDSIVKMKKTKHKMSFLKLAIKSLENDKKSLMKLQTLVESMLILMDE